MPIALHPVEKPHENFHAHVEEMIGNAAKKYHDHEVDEYTQNIDPHKFVDREHHDSILNYIKSLKGSPHIANEFIKEVKAKCDEVKRDHYPDSEPHQHASILLAKIKEHHEEVMSVLSGEVKLPGYIPFHEVEKDFQGNDFELLRLQKEDIKNALDIAATTAQRIHNELAKAANIDNDSKKTAKEERMFTANKPYNPDSNNPKKRPSNIEKDLTDLEKAREKLLKKPRKSLEDVSEKDPIRYTLP